MHTHNFEPDGRCICGEHIAMVPTLVSMYDENAQLRAALEQVMADHGCHQHRCSSSIQADKALRGEEGAE